MIRGLHGCSPGLGAYQLMDRTANWINHIIAQKSKQSPRAWFEWFSQAMGLVDTGRLRVLTFFIKRSPLDRGTACIVFIDHMVTGNAIEKIEWLKGYLAKEFKLKDLGALNNFLHIEVARSKQGILIHQQWICPWSLRKIGMLWS